MIPPIPPLPTNNLVKKTGDTMSGDLAFSGTAAPVVAADAYAFKYNADADAGLVFNGTDSCYEFRDTLAVGKTRLYLTGILRAGCKRVSAQFDKVNATFAVVTGLTLALRAGLTYKFKAVLFVDASVVGGSKYEVAGTGGLTATAIIYNINLLDNATMAYTITSRQTALAGAAGQAGTTAGLCIIEGLITVNAGGNLNVAFAQNAANGTSSVLVGSTFEAEEVI